MNIEQQCANLMDFYNYMNFSDTDNRKLNKQIVSKFRSEKIDCQPSWITDPLKSWPKIDTLNIFRTENIYQALAHELVKKSNETAIESGTQEASGCIGFINIETRAIKNERDTITSTESFKLFTCYKKPKVSFHMYVSPFDPMVWLLFLIHASLVWLVFHILIRSQQELTIDTSYSPFLFVLGSMIDEAYEVPKKLGRLPAFKVLILGWVLTSMLLSSCYQSILVVELNSPLKGQPLRSAHQLFCLPPADLLNVKKYSSGKQKAPFGFLREYWVEFSVILRNHYQETSWRDLILKPQRKFLNRRESENCYAILLFPLSESDLLWSFGLKWSRRPEFFPKLQFQEYNKEFQPLFLKGMLNRKFKLTSGFLSPLSRHFYMLDDFGAEQLVSSRLWAYLIPRREDPHLGFTALEWEIARNTKVAVVGPEPSLINEINYLKKQHKFIKQCTIFSESLASLAARWTFRRPYEHKLDEYFKSLLEAGIYAVARNNEKYRNTLKRLHGSRLVMKENQTSLLYSRVQAVKLNGSIQTIFEMWVVLLVFAGFGLALEIALQVPLYFKIDTFFDTGKLIFKLQTKFLEKAMSRLKCLLLFMYRSLFTLAKSLLSLANKVLLLVLRKS